MSKKFYITTTLPYVNSDPHIGFAMEVVRADIIARYHKLCGDEVFFNTGTDEHGSKIFQNAKEKGVDVQDYVNGYADKFRALIKPLGLLSEVNFTRTTDEQHIKAAQEFWKLVDKNGYIYKKEYSVKYCVGCELEKTDSELDENGCCPIHPNREIELINEENYFFKFSAFAEELLNLYNEHPDFVVPSSRLGEIRSFVSRGLEDFSISRLKEKMPWGVPVPGDDGQVMYVWFDALVNYISAIGWPSDTEKFHKWWKESGGVVQYCGKDNLRQQSAMWQAMLMAAELPPSKQIIINGFITSGGHKMSKSIGNVIDPFAVVEEYGTDAFRYFVAREISTFEDSDVTLERIKEAYNGSLANGIGNLASRIMKMAEENIDTEVGEGRMLHGVADNLEKFEIQKAIDVIWEEVQALDQKIQTTEPFKMIKTNPGEAKIILRELVVGLRNIATSLLPFMPTTAETILSAIKANKKPENIFSRK